MARHNDFISKFQAQWYKLEPIFAICIPARRAVLCSILSAALLALPGGDKLFGHSDSVTLEARGHPQIGKAHPVGLVRCRQLPSLLDVAMLAHFFEDGFALGALMCDAIKMEDSVICAYVFEQFVLELEVCDWGQLVVVVHICASGEGWTVGTCE